MTPGGGNVLGNGLTPFSTLQTVEDDSNGYITHPDRRPSIIATEAIKKLGALAMTTVESDDADDYAVDDDDDDDTPSGPITGIGRIQAVRGAGASVGGIAARRGKPHRIALPSSRGGLELPLTPADEVTPGLDVTKPIDPAVAQAVVAQEQEMEEEMSAALSNPTSPTYQHPNELYANLPAKLAALRRPSVVQALKGSGLTGMTAISQSPAPSPPILFNSKCSGYFVEPVSLLQLPCTNCYSFAY